MIPNYHSAEFYPAESHSGLSSPHSGYRPQQAHYHSHGSPQHPSGWSHYQGYSYQSSYGSQPVDGGHSPSTQSQSTRPRTISQSQSYQGSYPPVNRSSSIDYRQNADYVVPSHRAPYTSERWEQGSGLGRPHTSYSARAPHTEAVSAPDGYFPPAQSPYSSYNGSPTAAVHPNDDPHAVAHAAAVAAAISAGKPHVCEICSTAFARGHDLKRHKDTHSNTKPHICECGKSFTRKDALKRHIFLKNCGKDTSSSRDD